jgi:signal transduction histidine kinase/putative methionine-R-sulfoxide reductase with GAF domain
MAPSRASGDGTTVSHAGTTDACVSHREHDRLVALHRLSTLVALQRRTDDVLREALQSAVSLVGGDAGAIHRWDAERGLLVRAEAHGAHTPIIRPEIQAHEGLTGRAFTEHRSIIENDYASSDLGTAFAQSAGLRAAVAVPIMHGGHCLGILSIGSYDEARVFDTDDTRLLELLAGMVAVALENADLNAQLEHRLERLRMLSHLSRLVSTSLDLDSVLPSIGRAAVEITGAVCAAFWLADEAAQTLMFGGTTHPGISADLDLRQLRYGEGASGWVAQHRRPLVIDDVFADGRSIPLDWWDRNGLKTSLTLPILRGDSLVAVLSLNGRTPFRPSAAETELLESFLVQAAAAIRNASLYSSVRRSQEQLQQIVDHSPAAISLKDPAGRYLLINRRWQERFTSDDDITDAGGPIGRAEAGAPASVLGCTDADLFPGSRAERTRQRDTQVLTDGQPIEYEATVVESDDRRTYLSVKFPLMDSHRRPYAVCTISTDITERKRAEEEAAEALTVQRAANEQLLRLNKAKSDFVAIVSHEFRTPLTGIQGFSELMRDQVANLDEMREYSADINREAERLNRMINELLDLDRMESGSMTLHLEALDVGAMVTRIVASTGPRAPRHRLGVEVDPSLPLLAADPDKLTQVIVNLLDNAIKYSPDGGEIVVGARADCGAAHLTVRDQGLGIPPDALDDVFERYSRIESARHRSIHGTGLGLPIVRQIAELHGGHAWAEGNPGRGTTLHVTLPLPASGVTVPRAPRGTH